MNNELNCCLLGLAFLACALPTFAADTIQLPVSTTITTELMGKSQATASNSVVRIVRADGGSGSGFLHRSGRIITNWHVIEGPPTQQIQIMTSKGEVIMVTNWAANVYLDIALLALEKPLDVPSFSINTNESLAVGTPVITWGFPGGYTGLSALLSVGNVSGFQQFMAKDVLVDRIVVNAAFNSGNSGGPLLDVESRTVVGVVVSKLAPIPPNIQQELWALEGSSTGVVHNKIDGTGKVVGSASEAQMFADIVEFLRSQTQLVIGYAVPAKDLRAFLKQQGIDP